MTISCLSDSCRQGLAAVAWEQIKKSPSSLLSKGDVLSVNNYLINFPDHSLDLHLWKQDLNAWPIHSGTIRVRLDGRLDPTEWRWANRSSAANRALWAGRIFKLQSTKYAHPLILRSLSSFLSVLLPSALMVGRAKNSPDSRWTPPPTSEQQGGCYFYHRAHFVSVSSSWSIARLPPP